TGPDVDISPPLYDFGDTPVGQTSEQQDFLIQNTGEGDLTLNSITVNSDFEQSSDCPETLPEEESCVVETTFVPAAAGNFFGLLSIVDNAEGSPHKASLFGYGTFFDITILPASINFGDQTLARPSLAHDVRLLNSGNETITIDSIESSSSVFVQTNDCDSSLAPSAFCTISVIFTPEATEYVTAQINITDSATGSPHNIDLMGSGIDPIYPDLDISPNFWDFGQILVGDTSEAEEFTVKNTGIVDVVISGIDANSEFAQTNDCPETLASDETCTISGTFLPQAAGDFSGYITVIDNTYSRYQTVLLKGAASHSGDINISFSASSVDFGNISINETSDTQSVVLTNSGTDDLTMGAVSIVGSEAIDFNMNTNCSSRSLDVGKSCIIDMDFKPTSSGYKTANVMIYDDAHDSPQPIALSGIGKSGPSNCSLTGRGVEGVAAPLVAVLSVLFSVFYISRRTVMRKHQQ
ncbi:MAG: choice-of-anchor D domain-containing protein, partial [Deltaproteobacteria bacterium]|nr:choice-of-anchor D domain-containing protein [Deltaproteobacteria bacterium]